MKTAIKVLFVGSLFISIEALANDPGALVRSIQGRANVSCHWVDNVGDTNTGSSIQFIDMGSALCDVRPNNNGGGYAASGVCKGHIRCSGFGNGWGDIYFENVHCPGAISYGDLICGRRGDSNASNRDFSEGVKSCLTNYILNEGTIVNTGTNQIIRQTPRRQAVQ